MVRFSVVNVTMIFAAAGRCGSRDDRAVEASETTFFRTWSWDWALHYETVCVGGLEMLQWLVESHRRGFEAMAVGVESSQRCGHRLFKLERLQSAQFNSGIQKRE